MTQHRDTIEEEQQTYFNLLADLGHTKHIGGLAATERLAAIIAPKSGDEVLDVGCGVGIGPIYLAEQYGCRVLGVDMTPRMIERAQQRVERHGVADQVAFRVADMHALPFINDSFNAAVAESVLSFSAEKVDVINEMLRVVESGGMVAFTEAIWVKPPPPGKRDFMARAAGMPHGILSHEEWRDILAASQLEEIFAESYELTALEESKNQYHRINPSDYLRTLGYFFKVLFEPQYRRVFRSAMSSVPKDYFRYVGYGIYGGRKR